jgi:hypothetical protein
MICKDECWELDSQGCPSTGAFYLAKTVSNIEYNLSVWLCDVTKYVFGSFPEFIYIF